MSVPAEGYDVAIVGAGPNGLTAAAYLARAGARVVVLEKRFERGGTLATDDYSTPFQYNLAQLQLPLGRELPPYADLGLEPLGVRFAEPAQAFSARVEPGGPELVVGRGGRGLGAEIEEMLGAASSAVAPLLYRPPVTEEEARAQLPAAHREAALALADATPRSLSDRAQDPRAAVILRYACGLAGFLAADAPLGLTGAFCVARQFSPAIVVGGSKNLANGLVRVAASAGARGWVSSEVTGVERAGDGFRLRTGDGRELLAGTVVSTLDPGSILEALDSGLTTAEVREAAERWVVDPAGLFTAHYGIKGAPPAGEAVNRVFGFADADAVERHFEEAVRGRLPSPVAGHLTCVSVHDPLQASPGPYGPLHTLRLQTLAPYALSGGDWDRFRTDYRRTCWEALVTHFPDLGDVRLLFQFCDTPLDLERRFSTTRHGSIRQGALVPEQVLAARPHPSCSSGRTPIEGLYLAGGSVHPGVPGSLAGGYNAAGLVAADLGLERWWPELAPGAPAPAGRMTRQAVAGRGCSGYSRRARQMATSSAPSPRTTAANPMIPPRIGMIASTRRMPSPARKARMRARGGPTRRRPRSHAPVVYPTA